MRPWSDLLSKQSGDIDRQFAETIVFLPMGEKTIAGERPDTERVSFEFMGVLDREPELAAPRNPSGLGGAFTQRIQTGSVILSVRKDVFATPPLKADHFQADSIDYRASFIDADHDRWKITLQRLGESI